MQLTLLRTYVRIFPELKCSERGNNWSEKSGEMVLKRKFNPVSGETTKMAETESDSDSSKESGARKRQRGDINVELVHHLLGQIQQNINVIKRYVKP